jgi:hypothetical protein
VLAYISRDASPLEIHCAIVGEHMIFSRTPHSCDARLPTTPA